MDYSCARDSGNLPDGFTNPLRIHVRVATVIESGKNINEHTDRVFYSIHLG